LAEQWKESVIVPTCCKIGDKTNCINYRGISLLSTTKLTYKLTKSYPTFNMTVFRDVAPCSLVEVYLLFWMGVKSGLSH
jgi:hypothetical protein